MTRVEAILHELCPDGVPFRAIGSLCHIFSGSAFSSTFFNTAGTGLPLIRIRDVNSEVSGTFYSGPFDERFLVDNGDILIGMDGDFRPIRWSGGRALLNQRVCRLQNFSLDVLPNFLFYVAIGELERIQASIQGSTVKHLSSRQLSAARVPVPPLEVQREIVRILDTFTELEAKLEAELEAELAARRSQYENYRDAMLAVWRSAARPLGEIGEFRRGRRFTKNDVVDSGIPSIHYGDIYTRYGVAASSAHSHVRENLRPVLRFAQRGDVVIAGVGETVEDVGKAVAWLGDEPVAVHDDTFRFRSDLNPKFVAYALQTADFHAQKNRHVARAKVKRLSAAGLSAVTIPAPPRAEQDRIVAMLDAFDALVSDLSIGLPAERAARRNQYEYYRDRLLTFEELEA